MDVSVLTVEGLEAMKYADLQKIAKKCGVKANMKADKLQKALKVKLTGPTEKDSTQHDQSQSEEFADTAVLSASEPESSVTESDTSTVATPMPPRLATPKMTPAPDGGTRALFPPLLTKYTPCTKPRTASPFKFSFTKTTPSNSEGSGRKSQEGRRRTYELDSSAEPSPVYFGRTNKSSPSPRNRAFKGAATEVQRSSVNKSVDAKDSPLGRKPLPSMRGSGVKASPAKRRASATNITKEVSPAVSPGVQEMRDSMREDMDSSEMKESLMAALDKKVKEKGIAVQDSSGEKPGNKSSSQIPRFEAFLRKQAEESNKKATPGSRKHWDQVHARHFDKMESIDTYLEKKRKRTESINASVKKMRMLAEETRNAMDNLNNSRTPQDKKKLKSRTSLFKSPAHSGVPYVPKVTSTSKMTINFANLQSPSGIKFTAAKKTIEVSSIRRSPRTSTSAVPSSATKENRKSFSVKKENRKSTATPFKGTPSLNFNVSQSSAVKNQPKFDLKASLSRPLTWKPYTGKLKPIALKPQVKAVPVKTRDDRRKANHVTRANRRNDGHMKRRGIVS